MIFYHLCGFYVIFFHLSGFYAIFFHLFCFFYFGVFGVFYFFICACLVWDDLKAGARWVVGRKPGEDIERLTGQLQHERTVREQKEQYAALARRIKQYPPREQTRQEIEALESEIAALEEDGKGIASKLELRSKQFAAFMHSVHDLQLSLAEEEQTKAGAMDTS